MKLYCGILLVAAALITGCGKQAPEVKTDEGVVLSYSDIVGISLPVPEKQEIAEYLGVLGKSGQFAINDVKGPVVLVHLFDMYCTLCQKEAGEVNRFYELLQRADAKDRVQVLGLGKGNTDLEVTVYAENYGVQFPLFPDQDKSKTKLLGVEHTPNFVIVDVKKKKVVYQQWKIESAEKLLAVVQKAAE